MEEQTKNCALTESLLNDGLAANKLDAERYRYFKSCFINEYQLIEFARRLGCKDEEFLPSLDYAIDAAMAANVY
jgi:hypothetical protein